MAKRYIRELMAVGFGVILTGFYYFLVEFQPYLSLLKSPSSDQVLSYYDDSVIIVISLSLLLTTLFVWFIRNHYQICGPRLLIWLLIPTLVHLLIRIDLFTFYAPLTAIVVLPCTLVICAIILPHRAI
ncbi:hypothetical protein QWY77_07220 [Thalassotalea ponticola]|uniref:hypothetical protein n=1 Tax=Thalassotalea ponticola TaxID=1523392 RepID=UPI0025B2A0C2|nr:hypothetical protein [Thalassotalea ponticola]MDN3652554.1 hypothetical protein [Thalassotalea ponticola]